MIRFGFLALAFSFLWNGCTAFFPPAFASSEQEKSVEEIREFPGLSKDTLYQRALAWVAVREADCPDTVAAEGHIGCDESGSAVMDVGIDRPFDFDMFMDFKDGKVRIQFKDIFSPSQETFRAAGPNFALQWNPVAEFLKMVKNDIFQFLENPEVPSPSVVPEPEKDDNW